MLSGKHFLNFTLPFWLLLGSFLVACQNTQPKIESLGSRLETVTIDNLIDNKVFLPTTAQSLVVSGKLADQRANEVLLLVNKQGEWQEIGNLEIEASNTKTTDFKISTGIEQLNSNSKSNSFKIKTRSDNGESSDIEFTIELNDDYFKPLIADDLQTVKTTNSHSVELKTQSPLVSSVLYVLTELSNQQSFSCPSSYTPYQSEVTTSDSLYTLDLASYSDGNYGVCLLGRDAYGNIIPFEKSQHLQINIDSTVPQMANLLAYQSGYDELVKSNDVFQSADWDVDFVLTSNEPLFNAQLFTNLACSGASAAAFTRQNDSQFVWEVKNYQRALLTLDAVTTLSYRMTDLAGNSSPCASFQVKRNSIPMIQLSTALTQKSSSTIWINSATYSSFEVSGVCTGGISTVKATIANQMDVSIPCSAGQFSYSLSFLGIPEGNYVLVFSAQGQGGTYAENKSLNIAVDVTAPTDLNVANLNYVKTNSSWSASYTGGVDNNLTKLFYLISKSAPNSLGNIADSEVLLPWTELNNPSGQITISPSAEFASKFISGQSYYLSLKSTDAAGNLSNIPSKVLISDTTAPNITASSLGNDNTSTSQTPTINVSAIDSLSGLKNILVAIGSAGSISTTPDILPWQTFTSGEFLSKTNAFQTNFLYKVFIKVEDLIGNQSEVITLEWRVAQVTLSQLSPSSGGDFGGETITLTGTNFSPNSTVTIGGNNCTNATFINSTKLSCVTPSSATYGQFAVQVDNGGGNSFTLSNAYTYRIKVAAGYDHTCAIKQGDVYCWGANDLGQLGVGQTAALLGKTSTPTKIVNSNHNFKEVVAGFKFSCAITFDGIVYCWGSNNYGQIGNGAAAAGSSVNSPYSTWSDMQNPAIGVSLGQYHACLTTTLQEAWCWGDTGNGKLSIGSTGSIAKTPVQALVSANNPFIGITQVSAGNSNTCFLNNKNEVYCAGPNTNGQLGDGTSVSKNYATLVSGTGENAANRLVAQSVHLSPYMLSSYIITTNNELYAFGDNTTYRALGLPTTSADQFLPVKITLPVGTTLIEGFASGRSSTCFSFNNKLTCAGYNGIGSAYNASPYGYFASGAIDKSFSFSNYLADIIVGPSLSGGHTHACAQFGSKLKCWGSNSFFSGASAYPDGRLGSNLINSSSSVPVEVTGF